MMKTDFTKLDAFLDSLPQRGLPLCNIAVSVGDEIVHRHSVNCEDDTMFWIYSTSKVSTCTAAMRLIEEGRLALEDPVSKYLPAFADAVVRTENGNVPCKTPLQIIHLFTMTGGLDYDLSTPAVQAANDAQADTVTVAEAIAKTPLHFEPGTHYRYSLCHDVLGAVIEKISGMTLAEYLKTQMYDPLGMTGTGFIPTEEQRARFAPLYRYNNCTGCADPLPPLKLPYDNPHYYSGGGGLFSTTGDYIKLMRTLALGGTSPDGYRLLKPETVAMMQQNRLNGTCLSEFRAGRLYGYGWGLCGRVHMNPLQSMSLSPAGEFGWDSATSHYALADTQNKVGLFFGTHMYGSGFVYNVLHPLIRNLAYEGLGLGKPVY